MIIVVDSRTPFGIVPRMGAACAHLMSADSRKPAIITAPTIAHLKTNRIFCSPPLQWILCPVFPLCAPSAILPASRVSLRVRFILFLFRPPFLCRSHPIGYNHSIASCQKNASGIRARAYNVIYIKRRFSCVIFTKTACAIGYFVV